MVTLIVVASILVIFLTTGLILRKYQFKRCCQGKKLHGVCAGLAKGMNIRPFWVRLGFIITTVYGLGLYLTCWVFLPAEN